MEAVEVRQLKTKKKLQRTMKIEFFFSKKSEIEREK